MHARLSRPTPRGQLRPRGLTATAAWEILLRSVLRGCSVGPRGLMTREVLGYSTVVDMRDCVLVCPARKNLSYGLMAAEAAWILRGESDVTPLLRHAPSMSRYCDDGQHMAGAHGPRVVRYGGGVIDAMVSDRSTRRGVLTIWGDDTKRDSLNVPCTVYLNFVARGPWLHCFARMRSSDAWLGFPYDVFSYCAVATAIAAQYNRAKPPCSPPVEPGNLYWSADSAHIYERNVEDAMHCLVWLAGEEGRDEVSNTSAWLDTWGFAGAHIVALLDALDRMERLGNTTPLRNAGKSE